MAISDGDKVAAATLAAARCVVLGKNEVEDYMAQYGEFMARFEEAAKAALSAKGGVKRPKISGF